MRKKKKEGSGRTGALKLSPLLAGRDLRSGNFSYRQP